MTGAGDLKWRIAFDKRVTVDDGYGNEQGAFAEQFVVAAHLKPRFGGEAVIAARLQGHQPVTITVRQSTQTRLITPDWRARDVRTSEVYAIRSPAVDPDGKRQWLEFLCQTGVAA
jgi:SPP1 family predicted phage head-tail adaptor